MFMPFVSRENMLRSSLVVVVNRLVDEFQTFCLRRLVVLRTVN